MSYKIDLGYGQYTEKTKDDLIAFLVGLYSESSMQYIKVTWPDGGVIEYEGEE